MDSSQKTEVPNQSSQENDTVIDIPEEWADIAFEDYFENGWKPRIKTSRGLSYITLRRGNSDKSLGPYTEERWQLVMSMFPKKVPDARISPTPPKYSPTLVGITMKRADRVPKTFTPTITTLRLFEILKEQGYPGSFDDFLNEIVETHFTKCHGIIMPLVISESR